VLDVPRLHPRCLGRRDEVRTRRAMADYRRRKGVGHTTVSRSTHSASRRPLSGLLRRWGWGGGGGVGWVTPVAGSSADRCCTSPPTGRSMPAPVVSTGWSTTRSREASPCGLIRLEGSTGRSTRSAARIVWPVRDRSRVRNGREDSLGHRCRLTDYAVGARSTSRRSTLVSSRSSSSRLHHQRNSISKRRTLPIEERLRRGAHRPAWGRVECSPGSLGTTA